MSYIAELINKECPECQGDRVAKLLLDLGMINQTNEHYLKVWNYFNTKKIENMNANKSEYTSTSIAMRQTSEIFKLSRFAVIRIRNRFEK